MAILNYNRKLAWVVTAAILWAFIGFGVCRGLARDNAASLFSLSIGMPKGGLKVHGKIREITEEPGLLRIVVALPPDGPRVILGPDDQPAELPDNITIEFVDPADMTPGPPKISTLTGMDRPKEFFGGRWFVVTNHYLIKTSRAGSRIIPRPKRLTREWLRRQLGKELGEPGDKRPPPGRRPEGPPPDGRREGPPKDRKPGPPGDGEPKDRPARPRNT